MQLAIIVSLAMMLSACAASRPAPPSGSQTFAMHCVACHGPLGEGDGPVAAVLAGTVPNLRTLSERNGDKFPADTVASYIDGRSFPAAHGARMMPVWGEVFDGTSQLVTGAEGAQTRIEGLLAYLRELQYR